MPRRISIRFVISPEFFPFNSVRFDQILYETSEINVFANTMLRETVRSRNFCSPQSEISKIESVLFRLQEIHEAYQ